MPIPFLFELSPELWKRFRSSYYLRILRKQCPVKEPLMQRFYERHWLTGSRLLPLDALHPALRRQLADALPDRNIQCYVCADIVIAFVGKVPISVFVLRAGPGAVECRTLYIDASAVTHQCSREIVLTADAVRRTRHGAYATSGQFAEHLNSARAPGSFSVE